MEQSSGNLFALLDGSDDLPAIVDGDRAWSREQLRNVSRQTAHYLKSLGLRRGDVLAVWLPNVPAWLQLLFAASSVGVLVVPISTRYKPPEVEHALRVSRAKILVCPESFLGQAFSDTADKLAAVLPDLELVVPLDDLRDWLPTVSDTGVLAADSENESSPDDLLCCFSTSGTTGFPKLAAHDHAGIARHASLVATAFQFEPGDRLLASLPFYGVFGLVAALAALAGGAACDLMLIYRADEAAAMIDQRGITHVIGSDSMFDPILAVGGCQFKSWRRIAQADFIGLSLEVTEEADKYGIKSSGTYGSSEVFSLISFWPFDGSPKERARSGGVPIDPLMRFRICDPETGGLVQAGDAGELQIRGPNVFAEYLNNPEASANAFTDDGWFRTGDMARAEGDGFVYLARLGDGLRLRGYLVNPAEIELVLMQHPAVSGAQVVGVTRPGQADVAVAFVIQEPAAAAAVESELMAYCKSEMAAFKLPERIQTVEHFPSVDGPNGNKIQKRVLREMAAELIAQA
ncbi:MAG: AMP-binding protein [Burkholderiaceae bacterium]